MQHVFSVGKIALFAAALAITGCSEQKEAVTTNSQAGAIIPIPMLSIEQEGQFTVDNGTLIVSADDMDVQKVASMFADLMGRTSALKLTHSQTQPEKNAISFVLDDTIDGAEAYTLKVDGTGVEVRASSANGLFHGATTLWQLLTPKGEYAESVTLPAQEIVDAPRHRWRGIMLDSARHYQSPEFIKKFIDWMALHKLNVFHWHLIDDQAWRLEIKKYPKLTEIGAFRVQAGAGPAADIDPETGKPRLYGGYYKQDDAREIVAYAADRFITVMPEIEMPGHAQALLSVYPEYGVTGEAIDIKTDWGVFPHLYNVEEETFAFIEDVLSETMELFPSTYIHIGGDEALKTQWKQSARVQERMQEFGVETEEELQSYFVRRVEGFLNKHGRKLVGWDEILEGGLSPNATVMSWRGEVGGIEAAKQGHDVIMAPGPVLYFDFLQSDLRDEPPGRTGARVQPIETLYAYDPVPAELEGEKAKHVLGLQANIWTEHIRLEERVEHMAFPRMAAVSEIAWSQPKHKDFSDFLNRLTHQIERYGALGVRQADSAFQPKVTFGKNSAGDMLLELSNQTGFGSIHFSLDGTEPSPSSAIYHGPISLDYPFRVKAAAFYEGRQISSVTDRQFTEELAGRREDDDLATCSGGLELRLEDDAPVDGVRSAYNVDILNPCWIYQKADLSGVTSFEANIGQIPFNFQLGNRDAEVALPAPNSKNGELQVRLDSCEGELIAELALPDETAGLERTKITGNLSHPIEGEHDLCLQFTGSKIDPLWVFDWFQPVSKTALTSN